MRGEAALGLAAALEKLPDQQRIGVRMRHLEDMKINHVAAEMGITADVEEGFIRRDVLGLRKKFQSDSSLAAESVESYLHTSLRIRVQPQGRR